jgi:hypothetical protein
VSAIHPADALKHPLALAFAQGSARRGRATVLRRLAAAWFRDRGQFSRKWLARTCPICGYSGMFISVGKPPRWDARQRFAHFSGEDHRRFYGLDFAERLVRAGFGVATFRVSPEDEVRYGLLRDEWLTIARKPFTQAAERDHVGGWLDRIRGVELDCYGH